MADKKLNIKFLRRFARLKRDEIKRGHGSEDIPAEAARGGSDGVSSTALADAFLGAIGLMRKTWQAARSGVVQRGSKAEPEPEEREQPRRRGFTMSARKIDGVWQYVLILDFTAEEAALLAIAGKDGDYFKVREAIERTRVPGSTVFYIPLESSLGSDPVALADFIGQHQRQAKPTAAISAFPSPR